MTVSANTARSRLDPEPVTRRDWLGLSSVLAAGGALFFGLIGILKLPRAAVLSSPSKKFQVTLPDNLAPGTAFVPAGRAVAVFRDAQGIYAISNICTHLGCVVKSGEQGFECPCHGSRFALDGSVTKGPAPKPLPWLKVSVRGNAITIDEGATVPPGTKAA